MDKIILDAREGVKALSYYHLPLIGYFVAIAYSFYLIVPNYYGRERPSSTIFFHVLAIASLSATWKHMLLYFERSFFEAAFRANIRPAYFTIEQWLRTTSLFNEAWLQVCLTSERWWWSEQLCLWTVVLTVFLSVEARRGNIKRPTALLLFGFIVAISVAQNIFFAILALPPLATSTARRLDSTEAQSMKPDAARPSWSLIMSLSIALATIGLTPSLVPTPYFLPNLLVMHIILLVPFYTSTHSSAGPLTYSQLYYLLALANLALRIPTYSNVLTFPLTMEAVESFSRSQIEVFMSLPSQASISFDVVCSSISFLVWMMVATAKGRGPLGPADYLAVNGIVAMTPITGIGFTGALFLGWRESWKGGKLIKSD